MLVRCVCSTLNCYSVYNSTFDYLTTSFNFLCSKQSNGGSMQDNGLERMWKQAVVISYRIFRKKPNEWTPRVYLLVIKFVQWAWLYLLQIRMYEESGACLFWYAVGFRFRVDLHIFQRIRIYFKIQIKINSVDEVWDPGEDYPFEISCPWHTEIK